MDIKTKLSYITSFFLMIILSLLLFSPASFYLLHAYHHIECDYPLTTRIWVKIMHIIFNFDYTVNRFNTPIWLYFAIILILLNLVLRHKLIKYSDIMNVIMCILMVITVLTIYSPINLLSSPLK